MELPLFSLGSSSLVLAHITDTRIAEVLELPGPVLDHAFVGLNVT